MNKGVTLLWFRQDLRLRDNPALTAALGRRGPIIPVFIWDPEGEGDWPVGAASRWWLHHSLAALDAALRARGSRLVIRQGETQAELAALQRETGADALLWNRRTEPAAIARDNALEQDLGTLLEVRSFNASLLFEPSSVSNKQGGPFQVFTPYWRHCLEREVEVAGSLPRQARLPAPSPWPAGLALDGLTLLPSLPWARDFSREWTPGEEGAQQALSRFLKEALRSYDKGRDFPSQRGTSRLSPHLHFGEIGPRQIWSTLKELSRDSGVFPDSNDARRFLAELGWREFAHHLLFHFPQTPVAPLRAKFERFSWAQDREGRRLKAWQRGMTGYPIVDAGMRELWATGWMHNRVRMIAASFLVKHLRLPWQLGTRWFWDTLVDADLAANTLGWQWSAGCGADAAPYFRIFNPVLQGRKFDPKGAYVRRWVPELTKLPDKHLHCPWEAPESVLRDAGMRLGERYPAPVVDHATARAEALAAFEALKGGS